MAWHGIGKRLRWDVMGLGVRKTVSISKHRLKVFVLHVIELLSDIEGNVFHAVNVRAVYSTKNIFLSGQEHNNRKPTKEKANMTKKHFIALANWIKEHKQYANGFNDNVIESLANFCQTQNVNFNRNRFVSYIKGECGSRGGKVK